ncbi:sperm-associated microtubule inner protein 4 [Diretmus argenteus]
MESKSPQHRRIPDALRGHQHLSYGGAVIPENVTIQQHYDITSTKKSNLRLNDQLIPKPTDINIAEHMIKVALPKEHPYSSHISRFAMFPSFHSPDDPDTGVRAASQPSLSPLIPTSAPEVTVLSKAIGGPYRHEILDTNSRKGVLWTGEHGFLDHTKPVKGESQVFYPSPPKTVFPNPKLRNWDISLSERTTNMLRNLEKTLWLTSYQMHYTGSGPANPLKIDDFNEKLSDLATGEMTSHTTLLRERSYPVFVPSTPREGCKGRRRQGSRAVRSAGRPPTEPSAEPVEPPDPSPAPNQHTAPASIQRPRQTTADPNPKGHSQAEYSSSPTELSAEGSQELLEYQQTNSKMLKNQQPDYKNSEWEIREKENRKVHFEEGHMQVLMPQSSQGKIKEHSLALYSRPLSPAETEKEKTELWYKNVLSNKKQDFKVGINPLSLSQSAVARDQTGIDSDIEVLSRAALEQEKLKRGRELPSSTSNPSILPRPPVLPGIHPVGRVGSVGAEVEAPGPFLSSLLELQDSFSKSEVHRSFSGSIRGDSVDLRDNICMGKKHNFYGIHCHYLHG